MARKKVEIPEGRPSEAWTVSQIKQYIKRETAKVNIRIAEFRQSKFSQKTRDTFERLINKVKSRSGVKSGGNRGEVGTGLSNKKYRRKNELLYQARGLETFEQYDIYSDTAEKEFSDKVKNAYATYTSTYRSDMTLEQYNDMVNMLGSIGSAMLGKFDYRAMIEAWNEAIDDGREVNLVSIVNDAVKEAKGEGWDFRRLTDEIVKRI